MTQFKRKIFYLAGFDPRGARFYHRLLADQLDAHNAKASPHFTISSRRKQGDDIAWTVTDDAGFTGDHTFLQWDDLVRSHWVKGPVALFLRMLVGYWHFLVDVDWNLVREWPKGTKLTLYMPGVMTVILPLLLSLILWGLMQIFIPGLLAIGVSSVVGVGVAIYVLRKIHGLWLVRFVIFNDWLARGKAQPALHQRVRRFAETINQTCDEDWDEVQLVCHSNGSILAMSVMTHLMEMRGQTMPANFHLVTLGFLTPLLAGRTDSPWYSATLDKVGAGDFAWLDIGSITDGACFALVDPCQGRAIPRPPRLVQLSPRWFKYCDPATYKARRAEKFETHFDYLRRLDMPSPLDYIGLTCSAHSTHQSIAAFEAENG